MKAALKTALILSLLASSAYAIDLNVDLNNKTATVLSPVKKNALTINGKTYLLPDNLKIIQDANGLFKIDKSIDLLGHKVGNGGDYLRGQFILIGEQVLEHIEKSDLANDSRLNLNDLKDTLDINKIAVVNDLLIDNTGSVVDAIGVPGLILLQSDSWNEHFEKQRNVYYLVLHEMLRSAGVNDDNYVISKLILDFPVELQVNTRLVPLVPLINEDSLVSVVNRNKIQSGGTGCVNRTNRFFTDLNLANNSFEISFYDYITSVNADKAFDRKACSLTIPVTLPAGKKLVVSLIDVQGQVSGLSDTSKTSGKLSFEAFLAGSSQKIQTKTMTLNQGKRSFIMRKTNVLSSNCGGESQLRINTNALLTTASGSLTAAQASEIMQVKKISVYMNLEDCQ
ncbi:DUF4360 domain-containing protein [bacterium]|nr:DUF4360 domain-containing protein [bacterium]